MRLAALLVIALGLTGMTGGGRVLAGPPEATAAAAGPSDEAIRRAAFEAWLELDPTRLMASGCPVTIAPPRISDITSTSLWAHLTPPDHYDATTHYQLRIDSALYGSSSLVPDIWVQRLPSGRTVAIEALVFQRGMLIGISSPTAALLAPASATGLIAFDVGTSTLRLRWNPVEGATGYKIFRDREHLLATVPASPTWAILTGLPAGQTVELTVVAFNATGDGIPSAPLSVTMRPEPPVTITISEIASTSFRVAWPEVWGAATYVVELDAVELASLPATVREYRVTGQTPGATVSVRLLAMNAGGTSVPSTATVVLLRPPAPGLPRATAIASYSFVLAWDPVRSATGYRVYRDLTWCVANVASPVTSVRLATWVVPLDPASMTVVAVNPSGDSDHSPTLVVVPQATPTARLARMMANRIDGGSRSGEGGLAAMAAGGSPRDFVFAAVPGDDEVPAGAWSVDDPRGIRGASLSPGAIGGERSAGDRARLMYGWAGAPPDAAALRAGAAPGAWRVRAADGRIRPLGEVIGAVPAVVVVTDSRSEWRTLQQEWRTGRWHPARLVLIWSGGHTPEKRRPAGRAGPRTVGPVALRETDVSCRHRGGNEASSTISGDARARLVPASPSVDAGVSSPVVLCAPRGWPARVWLVVDPRGVALAREPLVGGLAAWRERWRGLLAAWLAPIANPVRDQQRRFDELHRPAGSPDR